MEENKGTYNMKAVRETLKVNGITAKEYFNELKKSIDPIEAKEIVRRVFNPTEEELELENQIV